MVFQMRGGPNSRRERPTLERGVWMWIVILLNRELVGIWGEMNAVV
jgi:hypothetical protein